MAPQVGRVRAIRTFAIDAIVVRVDDGESPPKT